MEGSIECMHVTCNLVTCNFYNMSHLIQPKLVTQIKNSSQIHASKIN